MNSVFDVLSWWLAWPVWVTTYIAWGLALFYIAKKTDTQNGWWAFVPILNLFLLCDIAGMDYAWLLLLLVPCIDAVFIVYIWWQVCEERDKPGIISVLMVVPFVNLLTALYLAFSE